MKRQISLLACLLMLVAMVFAMASCVQPEANHVHNYVSSVTKEATCTENGELTYTCECGDTYTDEVQAKGHTPGVLAAVEPTCSTEGKTEGYGCTTCGTATTPQSVIAPLGHELGAPATCTTAQVCARGCGKVFVEALGHKGNEATCTEASVCYACNIELAEALGHEGNEATCTEASICYACETELEPALGHGLEYGMECCSAWCFRCGMEWVEATKEHEYMYACDTNCMNCYEFTRWEATHTMVFVEYKAPTCTELGNIEHWTCTDCNGCWDNENAMGFPLNQMMVKLWMVDHEYRYACDAHCMNCGNLTNEEAAHTLNHVDAVAPTCTENGNVEYWICSDCGTAWNNDQATGMPLTRLSATIPATGHQYFYQCDAHCMNCYQLTNEDAAHSLKHVAAVAPTCTENGNIEYWQCEFCGTAWDNANGTGFNLNRFMVIVNATGHEYAVECDPVCIRCYEIANPDAEHDIVKVTKKAATCTAKGYNVDAWYCTYCDIYWVDEDLTMMTNKNNVVVDALGHKGHETDYKCDVCNKAVLPEAGSFVTAAQANAISKAVGNTNTTQKYYITGIVTSVANTQYGNMYIKDETGEFYIYGLYSYNGSTRYDAMTTKPVKGDEVTVYTVLGCYNGAPQGKNAWLDDFVKHTVHTWNDATCTTPKTCPICDATEGDPAPHTFVAGVCAVCGIAEGQKEEWVLVTNVANLKAGDQIVLVAKNENWAMSTEQRSNNRGSVAITKSGDTVTINNNVQIITLESSGASSYPWNLKVSEGKYLYAASSSSNHLKTGSKGYNNATWTISISSTGVATIKANQTNRNWLRFNTGNSPKLFSCYGSGQTDVAIYKLTVR